MNELTSISTQVESFLKEFLVKLELWGVIFRDDRSKNLVTLVELGITTKERRQVLRELDVKDYVEGPVEERLNKGVPMWVFGRSIRGTEIYIKITLGLPSAQVLCISFHSAERPMTYPLRKTAS